MKQEELSSTQKAGVNFKNAGMSIGFYVLGIIPVGSICLVTDAKLSSIISIVYGVIGIVAFGIAAIQLYDAGSYFKGELK